MRDRYIDELRGINILLMILYTLLGTLSKTKLPPLLAHNRAGQLLLGDFVLPVFLFASGMSLYHFAVRQPSLRALFGRTATRLLNLGIAWFFLSIFTTNRFLGMDELGLNLVLTIPALLLVRLGVRTAAVSVAALLILHCALQNMQMLPDYTAVYLGGFEGAIWYLPVLVAGAAFAMLPERQKAALLGSIAFTAALWAVQKPDKMSLNAGFTSLSISFGMAAYFILSTIKLKSQFLIYVGKLPLRFWITMILFYSVLPKLWMLGSGRAIVIDLDWPDALCISLIGIVQVVAVVRLYELITAPLSTFLDKLEKRRTPPAPAAEAAPSQIS